MTSIARAGACLAGSPSQTAGPYLAIGMGWADGPYAAAPDAEGAFWLRGRLLDGNGEPVEDGMVETWQADPAGRFPHPDDPRGAASFPGFRYLGRSLTVDAGAFAIRTLRPGRLPDGAGGWQAPHINVSVFARGLLNRVITRIYFADELDANAEDDVLNSVPDDQRATLLAQPSPDGYAWDIVLQGERETAFFTV